MTVDVGRFPCCLNVVCGRRRIYIQNIDVGKLEKERSFVLLFRDVCTHFHLQCALVLLWLHP